MASGPAERKEKGRGKILGITGLVRVFVGPYRVLQFLAVQIQGGTIAAAALALLDAGAAKVHAAFVRRIAATDSVGLICDTRIQVISAAPLLAKPL